MQHHLEVGDLEGHALLAADRAAEGLAIAGVRHRHVEAGLDAADRERGDRDPAVVEGGEELGVAAAALAEQVAGGDARTLEGQRVGVGGVPAELVVGLLGGEAGRARRDHDRGDLGTAVLARAGARGDRDQAGDRGPGVGDELLGAVDDPLLAVEDRLGAGGAGVRAGARLGEAEAGQPLARDQRRQPLLALLLGAVGEDRVDAEADAGLKRDAHRLVDAADLLDRHAEAGEVAVLARAAVLLRGGEAEEAELAHLLHDVDREVVRAVPLRGVGGDLLLGELADGTPELLVLG